MAARPGVRGPDPREPSLDMRVLRRLAIWGSAATFGLILVAIASYSQAGSRRPVAPAPTPSAPPEPSRTAAAEPMSLERIAALPAAAPDGAAEATAAEFGVDVGGATNFDGLRVLWTSLKNGNTALFDGLHPQVVVRENNRTKAPELRLVVGPIANVEAAARMCGALSTGKRYCQPVAFEGQRLAEAEGVVPERKTESKPERSKPAAKPKPAPTANTTPSVLRLFR